MCAVENTSAYDGYEQGWNTFLWQTHQLITAMNQAGTCISDLENTLAYYGYKQGRGVRVENFSVANSLAYYSNELGRNMHQCC